MRQVAYALLIALLISLGANLVANEVKPSKGLAISAGVVSALSAGLANYFTSLDPVSSSLIGLTAGSVTLGFQYHSKTYSEWLGPKMLPNFAKRAAVGLMVTGGVAFVATLPVVGIDAPPPYTFEGLRNVIQGGLTMTVLSTPVNMALSLLAKEKMENAGPIRRRLVEVISFFVNGAQSAATASAVSDHPVAATAIHASLAVAGSIGWAYEALHCRKGFEKAAGVEKASGMKKASGQ